MADEISSDNETLRMLPSMDHVVTDYFTKGWWTHNPNQVIWAVVTRAKLWPDKIIRIRNKANIFWPNSSEILPKILFIIHENAPENIVRAMAAILSRGKWAKCSLGHHEDNGSDNVCTTTLNVVTIRESVLALEQLSHNRTPQAHRYARAWHVLVLCSPKILL